MKPGQSIAAKYRRRLSRALTRCGELEKTKSAARAGGNGLSPYTGPHETPDAPEDENES